MDKDAQIGELLRRVETLEAQLGRLVLVAPLLRASSTGEGDQVQAAAADGATPQLAYTGKRFQHAGFKSRPLVDESARAVIAFARNGITNGAIVAEDDGHDPGLAAGEAVVYSPKEPTCRVWFDVDGVLHIDAKAAQDVVVNAGTAKVALHGDSTAGHTHAIPVLQVVNGGGTPIGTTAVGTTGSATDTINIPGTRRFKGA